MGNLHSFLFGEAITGYGRQQRPEMKRYFVTSSINKILRFLKLICAKARSLFSSRPRKNYVQQTEDPLELESFIVSPPSDLEQPTSSQDVILLSDDPDNDSASAELQRCPDEENYAYNQVDHVMIAIPELEYPLASTNLREEILADSSVMTVQETDENVQDDGKREKTKKVGVGTSFCDDEHEPVQENSSSVIERGEKRKKRKKKGARFMKHYSSCHRILLVGEGDFSFSACLAAAFGTAANMIATSLDSEEFLKENYKNAMSNIEILTSRGCKVIHGIDATKMANHALLEHLKFDRIVFNFPFAGFFRKLPPESMLRRHRSLVSKFLMNAKEMISEDGEIHISHKTNGTHKEWNLELIASSHGLRLIEAVEFNPLCFPGYNTKRGFGGDDNFNCYPCKNFKFGLKSV